jgi:4-hydroxy-tetrahydrodipicolinate reductase
MALRVCVAGATGWAGSALARGIAQADDLVLVGGVSRKHAGQVLGEVLGTTCLDVVLRSSAVEALASPCDVFVEFTKPEAAMANVQTALQHGAHVVLGTSGLSDHDLAGLGELAQKCERGLLAVGNFSLVSVLLQRFAEIAARHLPQWEVLDYADSTKPDAPSGTALELVHRLSKVGVPCQDIPPSATVGSPESRGATMNGMQVHAVRLPGYVLSVEVVFGMLDQRLILRTEAGSSAQPYVDGALTAIRGVGTFVGLKRGLDSVMDL